MDFKLDQDLLRKILTLFLAGCIAIGSPLLLSGIILDNNIISGLGGAILFGGAFIVAVILLIISIYMVGVAIIDGIKELIL